jgi:hypothetical protein
MMIDEDTPRSYTSPRDDRFFTPRTIARSNSTSTGTSDEWITPRYEDNFYTPRSSTLYDDRKDTARSYGSYGSAKGEYVDPSYAFPPPNSSFAAQAKQFYNTGYQPHNQRNPAPKPYRQSIAEEKIEYKNNQTEVDFSSAGIDEEDIEDIFRFARHGRLEEIEKLLEKGVPIDVRDIYGNTLLIIACQNGNKRVAKAVLRRGGDINARNFKGNTPLHYCYQCKLCYI